MVSSFFVTPYAFLIIIGVTSLSLNLFQVSNAYVYAYALINSESFLKVYIIIVIEINNNYI